MTSSLSPKRPSGGGTEDLRRYSHYLKAKGARAKDMHEEVGLRLGDWHFYYRRANPGSREDVVAIDGTGRVIDASVPSPWHGLLTADGIDAEGAHRRVSWLLVRPGPVRPGHPFKDPDVAASIAAPSLTRDEDTVTFEGWVIYPPETQVPCRLRIAAGAGATATVETASWSKVHDQ